MSSTGPKNEDHTPNGIRLELLAWWIVFAPIVAVHICYWLGAVVEQKLPLCLPYWDGCTSISATGRTPPGSFLFKPVMTTHGLFLAIFWITTCTWLSQKSARVSALRVASWIGVIGGLFLILYTTFLGSDGGFYNLMRRYGVIVYFSFTMLACLLVARIIKGDDNLNGEPVLQTMASRQVTLSLVLLLLGLLSIPAGNFVADNDRLNNGIEWTLSVLMQGNFLFYALAFRALRVELFPRQATPRPEA